MFPESYNMIVTSGKGNLKKLQFEESPREPEQNSKHGGKTFVCGG